MEKEKIASRHVYRVRKGHNILIDYLKEHEHITISKFCRKASINLKHAEDIIVDLLTIDLIDYENVDTKTVYSLKRTNNES